MAADELGYGAPGAGTTAADDDVSANGAPPSRRGAAGPRRPPRPALDDGPVSEASSRRRRNKRAQRPTSTASSTAVGHPDGGVDTQDTRLVELDGDPERHPGQRTVPPATAPVAVVEHDVAPPEEQPPAPPAPVRRQVRRGRRVRRIVRRIDLWSVLKLSLMVYTCLYLATMATLAALWGFAYSSGSIDRLESFMADVGLENFHFYGDQMFRASAAIGAVAVIAGTVVTVLATSLVNLISETTGGIRLVVIEEDPRPSTGWPTPEAER